MLENKNKKTPWPTKKVMEQIYELSLWGKNDTNFYSGYGSHNYNIIYPYISFVKSFLLSFKNPLTVCDLGCGDFNVGKQLVDFSKEYFAVDIVESLINHNNKKFKHKKIKFLCLDIAKDNLPSADCVILRQVLQHLSNTEILKVLKKISEYKYVIVTEHIPSYQFIPNKDIISGQGIRLKKQSGVDLLASPFKFKIKEEKQVLSIDLDDKKGVIKTIIYKQF